MITFLLFIFGAIFCTIALMNFAVSWWLRSLVRKSPFYQKASRSDSSDKGNYQDPSHGQHHQQNQNHNAHLRSMVSCAYCQTYSPEDQMLYKAGQYFCDQEHLELFEKKS